jgi:hypothetical protein
VAWDDLQPFYEDSLVGKTLQLGEGFSLHVVKKDERCIMITLDPETAKSSPEVLNTVSKKHAGCVGIYGAVLNEGIVRVNDPVYVA